jgi:hypothetical protein
LFRPPAALLCGIGAFVGENEASKNAIFLKSRKNAFPRFTILSNNTGVTHNFIKTYKYEKYPFFWVFSSGK